MSLRLHTAATAQVLTTEEAKLHLRVDVSDDDALINSMVQAATAQAEHLMQRAVMPQKWLLSLQQFPVDFAWTGRQGGMCSSAIDLRRPPVSAIDSLTYIDSTGASVELPSSEYQLVTGSDCLARLVPAYGKAWPSARCQPDAVQVLFTTGYAYAAAVPEPIKAWIKLCLGSLYENRAGWTRGTSGVLNRNEFIDHLLDGYRTITL